MLTVSQLYIYPVKSLGGIALQKAEISDRGLKHDRRWMLIDDDNRFLSQRSHPLMALFQLTAANDGFEVVYLPDQTSAFIAYEAALGEVLEVSVWDDHCNACLLSKELDAWFSQKLGFNCRLVYMPDDSYRPVDARYALNHEAVSLADAYPFLLVGEASLEELNSKLETKVSLNRFRPNIVFTGGEPHLEDRMAEFMINNIHFYGVKPCARCVMVGVNQETARSGKEPMKTLASYRTKNNKIYFGQNLLHKGEGFINAGDVIEVKQLKPEFITASPLTSV